MALAGEGIWVRLTLADRSQVTGFASGADSPNDFWSKFRTQLVRLDDAQLTIGTEEATRAATLYVNRDRILVIEVTGRGR